MDKASRILKDIDMAIVTSQSNMRYLSGFTADSGAVIAGEKCRIIISDFRYTEQAARQSPSWEYHEFGRGEEYKLMAAIARENGAKKIAYEENSLTVTKARAIREAFNNEKADYFEFSDISKSLVEARAVKDDDELDKIRRACELGDRAFSHMLAYIKPGMTEIDIALELEFFLRKNGAEALSFDCIIASGENGSLPHAIPSKRKVSDGDMITLDFGCIVDGYCSDMTRTIALGDIAQEQRNVYNSVLEAQLLTCEKIRSGMTGREADALARNVLAKHGFEDAFGHGLGHGVGIDIHEEPTLNPMSSTILEEGMIVTIEPGVYLPGFCGVRIEDCGVISKTGFESFTHSDKDLICL